MTAKYHGRKRRNNRRERDRVKKALGRADETPPVDCDAVTVDGALMYIAKNHLATASDVVVGTEKNFDALINSLTMSKY